MYRFPKGGVYEGEWRGGRMEGVGVRTFASGKVQASPWLQGTRRHKQLGYPMRSCRA